MASTPAYRFLLLPCQSASSLTCVSLPLPARYLVAETVSRRARWLLKVLCFQGALTLLGAERAYTHCSWIVMVETQHMLTCVDVSFSLLKATSTSESILCRKLLASDLGMRRAQTNVLGAAHTPEWRGLLRCRSWDQAGILGWGEEGAV